MRVCQFRHDGNLGLQCSGGRKAAESGRPTVLFLQPHQSLSNQRCNATAESRTADPYPSFAVIEIFAFSTFDTGQPFSAASAYF
jgi:hypothetical protein